MTSPLESSAIHVLARVEHSGSQLSISGSIDLKNLRLEQNGDSSRGEVEIRLVQQDASGAVLNQRSGAMHLQLTSAQVQEYLKTGLFFRTLLAPKDGWKTLRIIVTDRASGSGGSLIIPASEIR